MKNEKSLALHYMSTLAEVARESLLILRPDLRVAAANQTFYDIFRVTLRQTENKPIYELGNGQWNIPELKNLLERILPGKKVVRDYEVTHNFETIGTRTFLLNARQIDSVQLIIIALEDITARKNLEIKLAKYTKELEVRVAERTSELSERVKELEALNKTMVGRELKMVELKKEIANLEKLVKNNSPRSSSGKAGNGRNGNGKKGNGNHKNL